MTAYVTHFIQKEIIFLSCDLNLLRQPALNYQTQLKQNSGFAITAYNCFVKLNMIKDAYYNLCNAIEILFEAGMLFNEDVEKDITNLLSMKQA